MQEKVLIVDDEAPIRLAVRKALEKENMCVTEAADGMGALELLSRYKYHLLILDVMMKDVSGYEVLQKMRSKGDNTPVMMLSGKSEEMDQVYSHNNQKEQLYCAVWGESIVDDNTITVYVKRIRNKIEDDPKNPKYLKTIRGIGYILEKDF